jgi:hypothetical protein
MTTTVPPSDKRVEQIKAWGGVLGFWLAIRLTLSVIAILGASPGFITLILCVPIGPFTGVLGMLWGSQAAKRLAIQAQSKPEQFPKERHLRIKLFIACALVISWFLPSWMEEIRSTKPSERALKRYVTEHSATLNQIYTLASKTPPIYFGANAESLTPPDHLTAEQKERVTQIALLTRKLGKFKLLYYAEDGELAMTLWSGDVGLFDNRDRGISRPAKPPSQIIHSIENFGTINVEYVTKYQDVGGGWYLFESANLD